jgi:hypothetical protein
VAARQTLIRNADEFFQHCKTYEKKVVCEEGKHESRILFKVDNISRPEQKVPLQPVPGTMKVHQVKAGQNNGEILYRTKVCHCVEGCRDGGNGDKCINKEQTGPWIAHNLHVPKGKSKSRNKQSQPTARKKAICGKKAQSVELQRTVEGESEDLQPSPPKPQSSATVKETAVRRKVTKRQLSFQTEDISSKNKKPRRQSEVDSLGDESHISEPCSSKRQLREKKASNNVNETSVKNKRMKLQNRGPEMVEEQSENHETLRRSGRIQSDSLRNKGKGKKSVLQKSAEKMSGKSGLRCRPETPEIPSEDRRKKSRHTSNSLSSARPDELPDLATIIDPNTIIPRIPFCGTLPCDKTVLATVRQPIGTTATTNANLRKAKKGSSNCSSISKPCTPLSAKDVDQLLRALIHSPYKIQVTTAKQIVFEKINVKQNISVAQLKVQGDHSALQTMPNDIPVGETSSVPIVIEGDGNCIPRVGSILAHGNAEKHLEMRLQIAVELILHKESYLDEAYLSRGLPSDQKLPPARVGVISGSFSSVDVDTDDVNELYLKEIHEVLKPGVFMGGWQLFALASVLNCVIFSAYPKLGNPDYRRDLHRFIWPRENDNTVWRTPVILWSSNRKDMVEEYWIANHVSLVLPFITG